MGVPGSGCPAGAPEVESASRGVVAARLGFVLPADAAAIRSMPVVASLTCLYCSIIQSRSSLHASFVWLVMAFATSESTSVFRGS